MPVSYEDLVERAQQGDTLGQNQNYNADTYQLRGIGYAILALAAAVVRLAEKK